MTRIHALKCVPNDSGHLSLHGGNSLLVVLARKKNTAHSHVTVQSYSQQNPCYISEQQQL